MDTSTKVYNSFTDLYNECLKMERSYDIIATTSLHISFLPYIKNDFSPFVKGSDNEGKDIDKCISTEDRNRFFNKDTTPVVTWNGRDIPVIMFFQKVKNLMNNFRDLYSKAIKFFQLEVQSDFMNTFRENNWVTKKLDNYNLSFGISYREDLEFAGINNY